MIIKYLDVGSDYKIVGVSNILIEGLIYVEIEQDINLVNIDRPYYFIDGEITQPELVLTYVEKRKMEYPSLENQLDDIYHNGVDAWKSSIKTIKDKYPKP